MNQINLERELITIEKFLKKEGRQDFIDEIRTGSKEFLDSKMLSLAKHREEIKNTKMEDSKLIEITEQKKILEEPYREQLKMNNKLLRFISLTINEQDSN